MTAIVINLRPMLDLTDEQFYEFCRNNPELRVETNAKGELVIMPPTGGGSGKRNADLTVDVGYWNRQKGLGVAFDSSTIFRLPNGARRSPDVAWVQNDRWDALTPEEQEKFPPIAPDFVIELRSRTDSLKELEDKMGEYLENGVQLGWLIDPITKRVHIYRQGQPVEIVQSPSTLSGENVLPGFALDLSRIFT
jgi:Uma2 family endonuclease